MSSHTGECCQPGVDSAQWLFSQTKSDFVCQSCARFRDSWKVPVFVAPSPKKAIATRGSSRSLKARPAPTTAGSPPPTTAFAPRLPRSTSYRCIEPPDEEHLAEEVTQPIFGKRAPLLDFRHRI